MRKIIYSLFASLLCLSSLAQTEEMIQLEIGQKAPLTEYTLQNLEGELVTLKGLNQANGIIVVFSCNTCPFVVGSDKFEGWEKDYNDLAAYAAENKMAFVLVNSNQAKREDEDSFEAMRQHAEKNGYTMPYLLDANSTLANAFGAKTTPHVYMFNAEMKLVYKGSIDNSWDSKREADIPYLMQAMRQLVNGMEITMPESAPKGCSIKRI